MALANAICQLNEGKKKWGMYQWLVCKCHKPYTIKLASQYKTKKKMESELLWNLTWFI